MIDDREMQKVADRCAEEAIQTNERSWPAEYRKTEKAILHLYLAYVRNLHAHLGINGMPDDALFRR